MKTALAYDDGDRRTENLKIAALHEKYLKNQAPAARVQNDDENRTAANMTATKNLHHQKK